MLGGGGCCSAGSRVLVRVVDGGAVVILVADTVAVRVTALSSTRGDGRPRLTFTGTGSQSDEHGAVAEFVGDVTNGNLNLVCAGGRDVPGLQEGGGSIEAGSRSRRYNDLVAHEEGAIDSNGAVGCVKSNLCAINEDAEDIVKLAANPLWVLFRSEDEFTEESRVARQELDLHGEHRRIKRGCAASKRTAERASGRALFLTNVLVRCGGSNDGVHGITTSEDRSITDPHRAISVGARAVGRSSIGRRDELDTRTVTKDGLCKGVGVASGSNRECRYCSGKKCREGQRIKNHCDLRLWK